MQNKGIFKELIEKEEEQISTSAQFQCQVLNHADSSTDLYKSLDITH
jgi:hypothetical protein